MCPARWLQCWLLCFGCLWHTAVWAQGCVTCRTEACPTKETLKAWCGAGKDPQAPAPRPLRPRPPARPAAVEEPRDRPAVVPAPVPPVPPPPLVEPPPPAVLMVDQPPRPRPAWIGPAKWGLLGTGAVLGVVGTALLAVHGRPTCDVEPMDTQCPKILNTLPGGMSAAVLGYSMLVGAAVLFVLDHQRYQRTRR